MLVFGIWANIFWISGEKNSAGLSKLHSKYPEKHFQKIFFVEKITFFYHFRILREKFSTFCLNFLAGLSKLHSTRPEEFFEANIFLEKILFSNHFRLLNSTQFFFLGKPFNFSIISLICYLRAKRDPLRSMKYEVAKEVIISESNRYTKSNVSGYTDHL